VAAKSLDENQRADARRLKAAFKQWQRDQKAKKLPASQEEAADTLGFNQSALSQYLNGYLPLGDEALLRFCVLLGVDPLTISPAVTVKVRAFVRRWLEADPQALAGDRQPAGLEAVAAEVRALRHEVELIKQRR